MGSATRASAAILWFSALTARRFLTILRTMARATRTKTTTATEAAADQKPSHSLTCAGSRAQRDAYAHRSSSCRMVSIPRGVYAMLPAVTTDAGHEARLTAQRLNRP